MAKRHRITHGCPCATRCRVCASHIQSLLVSFVLNCLALTAIVFVVHAYPNFIQYEIGSCSLRLSLSPLRIRFVVHFHTEQTTHLGSIYLALHIAIVFGITFTYTTYYTAIMRGLTTTRHIHTGRYQRGSFFWLAFWLSLTTRFQLCASRITLVPRGGFFCACKAHG
jgi:hypothetical protein